ncbi:MAG: N-acetylmuramoyl-L-alanine amidase, partial [Acidimicrobiales bacterium]
TLPASPSTTPDPGSGPAGPPMADAVLPALIMTPTGVVVPVTGRDDEGYRVSTPCGNEDVVEWGVAINAASVVLDPGHGGDEEGAIGPSGQTEAELNLEIARRAATILDARGFPTVLTRTADYRITVPQRAAIADALQAQAFVSIHHNSPTPEASATPGTEVFVQNGSEDSERLGGLLYAGVIDALQSFDVAWSAMPDAGVLTVLNAAGDDAYGINRYPIGPAALVEMAYISSPDEDALLATDEYRQAMATAVADAVVAFLTSDQTGFGFVEDSRLTNAGTETGGSDGCVDPDLE